ncbi:olfactory receptor 52E2-like [Rhinophrynus dorsalis]
MENGPNISTSFILLGLVEMEEFKYLYCAISIVIYLFIMLLSFTLVFVIFTEVSLHEPMYILICNLILNGIFGSTSFFPKLIIDLLTSSKQISRDSCLTQVFCITMFAFSEISTITVMAYDRYLAVCQPLQYVVLMTNKKVLKIIFGFFIFCFISIVILVVLSARLPVCGSLIRNIFCDNMSFLVLSCVDFSVNNIYASVVAIVFLIFTTLVIAYSYMQIFLICLKNSTNARHKAIHTLVTHLLNYSAFLIGVLFIFVRYRIEKINLSLVFHSMLSATSLVFPPLINPLIYGIRTKALKIKVVHKINAWTHL